MVDICSIPAPAEFSVRLTCDRIANVTGYCGGVNIRSVFCRNQACFHIIPLHSVTTAAANTCVIWLGYKEAVERDSNCIAIANDTAPDTVKDDRKRETGNFRRSGHEAIQKCQSSAFILVMDASFDLVSADFRDYRPFYLCASTRSTFIDCQSSTSGINNYL